ncbi:MAG: hypothetical protein Q4F13_11760 [Pseudomonadota bacterium]|nr:hypothetical protein [Pseudomonadota bacterium]
MSRRRVQLLLALSASVVLAACGGDGDDQPDTPQKTSAEGVWRFDAVDTASGKPQAVDMVVLETGQTWFASHDTATLELVNVAYGQTQSGSGSLSGAALIHSAINPLPRQYGYSGTYTVNDRANVDGELWAALYLDRKSEGRYWSGYEQPASLSEVAGSYQGLEGCCTASAQSRTMTISPTGDVTLPASESGCERSGTLSPRASGRNIFDIEIKDVSNACPYPVFSGNGIAYYDSSTRRLTVLTSRQGANTDTPAQYGYTYLGVKSSGG